MRFTKRHYQVLKYLAATTEGKCIKANAALWKNKQGMVFVKERSGALRQSVGKVLTVESTQRTEDE